MTNYEKQAIDVFEKIKTASLPERLIAAALSQADQSGFKRGVEEAAKIVDDLHINYNDTARLAVLISCIKVIRSLIGKEK